MAEPFDPALADELATHLRQAMAKQGVENTNRLYTLVVPYLGDVVTTSPEQLRKMKAGQVNPKAANLNVLWAILQALDLPPDGLGPVVERRLRLVLVAVGADPGPEAPGRRPKGDDTSGNANPRGYERHPIAA